jgi:CubicO group peptidase (beta-lactamase class C family)
MVTSLMTYGPKCRLAAFLVVVIMAPAVAQGQSLPTGDPEQLGFSRDRLGRLTQTLDEYVAGRKLAGGVVLVARHGRVAYLHPFGMRDVEAGSAMQADAIFRIASQTKALVSAGIMMLMEDGALLLTDPVGKYIPEFSKTKVAVAREGGGYDVVDARRPITIRDLLTHTAGIHYGLSGIAREEWVRAGIVGWYFADRNEPMDSIVVRIAALPFETQPGERFVYGYATDILGVVIERISGMSLDEFLRARILGPLRMNDTHFFLPPEKRDRLTVVYSSKEDGTIVRAPAGAGMAAQGNYVTGPRKAFGGGAGLLSTARDYARFLQMLLNGGELDGVRLLSPASVKLMTADHVANYLGPDRGFGLGFETIEDLGAYGQPGSEGAFGWGGAYHSSYWVDPAEGLVVVYLTQLAPARGIDDFGKLRALVYSSMVGRGR